ncbi:hypothetical protein IMSAG249_01445 [Lachnospiraceae bacterium]|nr:hypothetical protein IMSAGC009_02223 [Lachnospiraceae bacterium]GFI69620.1 hypothetical protein IMSAG249_01445 [Lachnospiraceae bacterium]
MEKNLVRLLKADEIECRISMINEKGLSLLLYKDARVDQRILDETFGAFGWKRSHQCIDGNLYCTVEVFDKETMQWIAKQDVGTMGYTEKEKSQASDSFKRACFNWGIGRELYSAPFIWIPAGKVSIQMKEGSNKEKRYYCNDRFSVISITYNNDREIAGLVINNDKDQIVYELKAKADMGSRKEKVEPKGKKESGQQKQEPKKEGISKEQMDSLQAELDRTGVTMETVQGRYQIQEPQSMSRELYGRVMSALKRTKSTEAA